MNTHIKACMLITAIGLSSIPVHADNGVIMGSITNKYGNWLAFTGITVTGQYTTNILTDRNGRYVVQLPAGEWSIQPDNAHLSTYGYSHVTNKLSEVVTGQTNTVSFLVIATEPPWEPELVSIYMFAGQITMGVRGQGGRRHQIQRSFDGKNWSIATTFTSASGGLIFGSGNVYGREWFRVVVLE